MSHVSPLGSVNVSKTHRGGALAIWNTIPWQVFPAHVGGPNVQFTVPFKWGRGRARQRFPRRRRVALTLRSLAFRRRTSELEHASLRAGVRVELQRVVVSPMNVETTRHTHQRGWTIRPALVWLCLRLGEVPPESSTLPRLSIECSTPEPPLGGTSIRRCQCSVTIDTQYPVRFLGADARAVGGGPAGAPRPRPCPCASASCATTSPNASARAVIRSVVPRRIALLAKALTNSFDKHIRRPGTRLFP